MNTDICYLHLVFFHVEWILVNISEIRMDLKIDLALLPSWYKYRHKIMLFVSFPYVMAALKAKLIE